MIDFRADFPAAPAWAGEPLEFNPDPAAVVRAREELAAAGFILTGAPTHGEE